MNTESYPKENYELSPLRLSTINSARRNSQCKPAIVLIQADVHWIYGNVLTPLLLTNVILEMHFAKKISTQSWPKVYCTSSLSPWWEVRVACWKTYQWAHRRQTAPQVEVTSPGVSRSFFFFLNGEKTVKLGKAEHKRTSRKREMGSKRRVRRVKTQPTRNKEEKTSFMSPPYAFMILRYSKMTHITGRQKRKTNLCECNS